MSQRLPAAERRQQLVRTAITVFAEQGYAATTMDSIAVRAGITKPILYRHFDSKHDLFLTLMSEIGRRITDQVVADVMAATTPYERVQFGVKSFVAYMVDHNDEFRLAFGEGSRSEAEFMAILEQFELLMAQAIADLTDIPELSMEARLLMARGVVAMVESIARFWLTKPGEISVAELTDYTTDLIWLGLRGRPPSKS